MIDVGHASVIILVSAAWVCRESRRAPAARRVRRRWMDAVRLRGARPVGRAPDPAAHRTACAGLTCRATADRRVVGRRLEAGCSWSTGGRLAAVRRACRARADRRGAGRRLEAGCSWSTGGRLAAVRRACRARADRRAVGRRLEAGCSWSTGGRLAAVRPACRATADRRAVHLGAGCSWSTGGRFGGRRWKASYPRCVGGRRVAHPRQVCLSTAGGLPTHAACRACPSS